MKNVQQDGLQGGKGAKQGSCLEQGAKQGSCLGQNVPSRMAGTIQVGEELHA